MHEVLEKSTKVRSRMMDGFRKLHEEDSGQDLIEYSLVAALIALAAVAAMKSLATSIAGEFTNVSAQLT
jgi:pilus assembly protein Flp/PilA